MIRLSLIKRRETLCSSRLFEDMSENKQEKEVAPPPPPGFEDVKAGAHLDEVAQVAEKLAKGEDLRLGTKKEGTCLLYTSPSPRDVEESRMPSSA